MIRRQLIRTPRCVLAIVAFLFGLQGFVAAGAEHGIICRLELRDETLRAPIFVSSIAQVSFDRRRPISREIAAYRKRRLDKRLCAQAVSAKPCLSEDEMRFPSATAFGSLDVDRTAPLP
jgi:hypothetical protein